MKHEGVFNTDDLVGVCEIGPCPACGETTVRNDRGGTTCISCAIRYGRAKTGKEKP